MPGDNQLVVKEAKVKPNQSSATAAVYVQSSANSQWGGERIKFMVEIQKNQE